MITIPESEASREFVQELQEAELEVRFDRITRLLYSTDASIYQMMPIGVAMPRDADEISAAVEIAGRHGVPILPRGGGSSLAGQAVGHALVLDLSPHMDQVLGIDPRARTVHTQPGITLGKLNQMLAPHGLMYGPDPASGDRATMGGILGNNSTGAHSIVYGMTVDHVLETDIVLADGSQVKFEALDWDEWRLRAARSDLEAGIYRGIPDILSRYSKQIDTRFPGTFRQVAGYNLDRLATSSSPNLASLTVGSEGTLGVFTSMKLNLVLIPKVTRLAMVHFSEMRTAMDAVPFLLESQPSSLEVLDRMLMDLTRDKIEYGRLLTFIDGDPQIVLQIEYAGESEAELDAGIQRLESILARLNHRDPVVIVSDEEGQSNVWYVRKVGLGILMSIRGDAKPIPFIEDAAVPVEHLADYISQIFDFAHSVGVERVAMYAHASAGCIHVRPLINLKSADGVRQMRQIAEKSVDLVLKYKGTTSGEHGEGLARGEFSEKLFGRELVQAFREVKSIFDPNGLMNPGKVVDVSPMDDPSRLRFGPDYAVPYQPLSTIFNFKDDGGFAGAVEMCNGAGVCRKTEQGVMCPSFQATRDEADSTRGRANALRAAMMGFLGPKGMSSEEVYEVLDLCLSCHACKSECPSAVDLAKIKAEFLYHYYQDRGAPLRTRLFANIAKLNELGQPLAPLFNLMLKGPGKWILASLGIHSKRSLPTLAGTTFSKWYQQQAIEDAENLNGGGKQVVFFHDTFIEHNEPDIGRAAVKVLEAAGYEPILLKDKACCGRPAVSNGMLDEAARLANHNIRLLAPFAMQNIPIVGCEPSCMTMLVDEYRSLVPGEEAEAIANATQMLDAFLVQEAEGGNLALQFDNNNRHILFHGHCQQKATFGTSNTHKMLKLIPNCTIEEVETGCCGMAGSFGYEKEHYDLSIKLAEMALAPAVRSAKADTIICAIGTSCRSQIHHTTGRQSLHPIEVLADALITG